MLGLPEIDEKEVMVKTVKEIQSIINVPLQIDSSEAEVIEAAVRIYNGKPIINSVNGKEKVMKVHFSYSLKNTVPVL
jgi:5-methyltetrahydrofolate--homocysteine methyltransferase